MRHTPPDYLILEIIQRLGINDTTQIATAELNKLKRNLSKLIIEYVKNNPRKLDIEHILRNPGQPLSPDHFNALIKILTTKAITTPAIRTILGKIYLEPQHDDQAHKDIHTPPTPKPTPF